MNTWENIKTAIKEQREIRKMGYLKYHNGYIPYILYSVVIIYFCVRFSSLSIIFIAASVGLFRAELNILNHDGQKEKSDTSILRKYTISGLILCAEMIYRMAVLAYFLIDRMWFGYIFILFIIYLIQMDINMMIAHFTWNNSHAKKRAVL